MKLTIDIGNTQSKLAVFKEKERLKFGTTENLTESFLDEFIADLPIQKAAYAAVGEVPVFLRDYLNRRFLYNVDISKTDRLKLPIKIEYKKKENLGQDRWLCGVAAHSLYPDRNILIITMGSCITYNFLSKEAVFYGFAISPGLQMRHKALSAFTLKLPLLRAQQTSLSKNTEYTTEENLRTGVNRGSYYEINGFIEEFNQKYKDLMVIFTGGDSLYFEFSLKIENFVLSNLELSGINDIIDLNV